MKIYILFVPIHQMLCTSKLKYGIKNARQILVINQDTLRDMYVKCEKHSSPLSRHWFGSAIRGRRSRRSVKHSETSHWIIVHHRVSCRFISTCRFVSFRIVLCRFVLCLALPLDTSIVVHNRRHVRRWDIMETMKAYGAVDKRACLRRGLTKYTKQKSKQKWGTLSRNVCFYPFASFGIERCSDFNRFHVLGASLEKSRQSSKSSWSGTVA